MTSKLIISRPKQSIDLSRKYKVYIDDKEVMTLAYSQEKEVDIEPGSHKIYLKIDWCRSNFLSVDIVDNQTQKFICGSNIKGWRYILGILYVTVWYNKYLFIKVDEKK